MIRIGITMWVSFIAGVAFLNSTLAEGKIDAHKEDRQKVIDFDGDLVEGMNKSPYDSLNQVSEAQKKRRMMHLYRKRKGFKVEVQQTLGKMRYVP